MWLTPWGYTSNVPANYRDLISKANTATQALQRHYGTRYDVGSSTNLLYAAAGGSDGELGANTRSISNSVTC